MSTDKTSKERTARGRTSVVTGLVKVMVLLLPAAHLLLPNLESIDREDTDREDSHGEDIDRWKVAHVMS